MNIWHNISPKRIKKDRFYAVIEISKGGKNKYELDKETGMLKLDRVLFTSTHYPAYCKKKRIQAAPPHLPQCNEKQRTADRTTEANEN